MNYQYSEHTIDLTLLEPVKEFVVNLMRTAEIPHSNFTFQFGWRFITHDNAFNNYMRAGEGIFLMMDNTRFPGLFNLLIDYWKENYPLFKWSQILLHVNRQPKIGPHNDELIGKQLMCIGFGDYHGGQLRIIPEGYRERPQLHNVINLKGKCVIIQYDQHSSYEYDDIEEGTKFELIFKSQNSIQDFSNTMLEKPQKQEYNHP